MPSDRATVRRRSFSKNFNADLIFWFFFIKKKEQRAEDYLYSSAKNYAGEQ